MATTCPNRDGTKSNKGCIFCSENGSGDFLQPHKLSVTDQFKNMVLNDTKWNANKYIIYFQSFTNTYLPVHILKKALDEALSIDGVVGISIGTRADCINNDMLTLLCEYNKKTFLNIELGLQTSNDTSHMLINSQFTTLQYLDTMKRLTDNNIFTVTHIILGLPFETKDDMINTIKTCINAKTNGIKLQLLYILKGTYLADLYYKNPFSILEFDDYISLLVEILEMLPKDVVIMRLTGDGKKEDLIEPLYSLNKRKILNTLDSQLKLKNTYQSATSQNI